MLNLLYNSHFKPQTFRITMLFNCLPAELHVLLCLEIRTQVLQASVMGWLDAIATVEMNKVLQINPYKEISLTYIHF